MDDGMLPFRETLLWLREGLCKGEAAIWHRERWGETRLAAQFDESEKWIARRGEFGF